MSLPQQDSLSRPVILNKTVLWKRNSAQVPCYKTHALLLYLKKNNVPTENAALDTEDVNDNNKSICDKISKLTESAGKNNFPSSSKKKFKQPW